MATNLRATFSGMHQAAVRKGTTSIMEPHPSTVEDEAEVEAPAPEVPGSPFVVSEPAPRRKPEPAETASPEAAGVNRTFKSRNPNHTKVFGWVDPRELEIDPDIQRPENSGLINGIAREYDPDAAGVSTVSIREVQDPDTGEVVEHKILVDGQQRNRAAIKAGYTEKVPAMIHRGLSRPEEAELFRRLNYRRSVTAINLFRSAIVEGDQDVLNIIATLDDLGIPFSTAKGFTAVSVARRLAARKAGILHFRWALSTVRDIYDVDGRGGVYDGRIIEAFARFHERFADRIDEKELKSKLLKYPGGLAGLIGHAETIRSGAGGAMLPNLCQALIVRYNFNKHKDGRSKLPDWKQTEAAASEES